ncbi:MAG: pirin family protein [Planctomycetaceae bacterium]
MITIRRSNDRGFTDHGWLKSYHTFSFADYRDPKFMDFRSLRVINEDRVEAGKGFDTHAHRDMEIVSYVLAGELEHKDSTGNRKFLRPGEFQRITAGTGITHSEFNPSKEAETHFYQIWLRPERKGIDPSYEQKSFDVAERRNQLQLVASQDAAEGSLLIHADAKIYLADLDASHTMDVQVEPGRHAWLQLVEGAIACNGLELRKGDAVAVSDELQLELVAASGSKMMLFDLA